MKQRKQTGQFMKRSRLYRLNVEQKKINDRIYRKNTYLAVIILAVLFSLIIIPAVYKYLNRPLLDPRGTSIVPQVVEVEATTDKYQERGYSFCYDPLICIRDVGEELGFDNKQILIAIKIAKAESGIRPDAIGKNTNGTYDMGVFQINDCHSKRISRQDRLDFEKNIRFAYKLRKEQGNWNAWSVCRSKVSCK